MLLAMSIANRILASMLRLVASTSMRGTNLYFSSAFLFAMSVERVPALPNVYIYAADQDKLLVAAMQLDNT